MPRWGQARKEVILHKALILQRLSEGWSIRALHADLFQSGLVSVTIKHFDSQVKKQLGYRPGHSVPTATGTVAKLVAAPALTLSPRTIDRQTSAVPASSPEADDTRLARFVHDQTVGDGFRLTRDEGDAET